VGIIHARPPESLNHVSNPNSRPLAGLTSLNT
jgi:hypothetical protein